MNKRFLGFFLSLLISSSSLVSNSFRVSGYDSSTTEEQAFFSGFYAQSSPKGDGSPVQVSINRDGFVRFDIRSRETSFVDWNLTEEYVIDNRLYSEEKSDYEHRILDTSRYYENGVMKSDSQIGPKLGRLSSTCKVRAYYKNVQTPFGLVTVMYDFTGFLVGESLLMTAAHGLYLDVTSGFFDDGVENYYFPGKIEVYGAIGLADDWGKGYPYYSLCDEIFMDTDYFGNRTINNDWALLRLENPLGRELSQRKLVVNSSGRDALEVVGYPSWNQEHLRQPAYNVSVLSSYGQFSYSTATFEGMSGSPLCEPQPDPNKVLDGYSWGYGPEGEPCLSSRLAYGMHISYDYANGIGYGLRFTNDMATLVGALNYKYRPSEIEVFSEGVTTADGRLSLSADYHCNMDAYGCSVSSGAIGFDSESGFVALEFNFPISGIRLSASSSLGVNYGLADISYEAPDGSIRTEVANSLYNDIEFQNRAKSITITARHSGVSISGLAVIPDWGYCFPDANHPAFAQDEIARTSTNNCVSYALRKLLIDLGEPLETITPKNPENLDEPTLNFGLELNPGFVVAEFKRELLSQHNILMQDIGKYDECAHGGYKVAILCDPFNYYHLARLNSDGRWSHFVPKQGISDADSFGNRITDLEKAVFCNGPYVTEGSNDGSVIFGSNYSELPFDLTSVIGYFEVYAA